MHCKGKCTTLTLRNGCGPGGGDAQRRIGSGAKGRGDCGTRCRGLSLCRRWGGEVGAAHWALAAWVAGIFHQNAACWDCCVAWASLRALVAAIGGVNADATILTTVMPSFSLGVRNSVVNTVI